jgi:hypothetical protein
MRVVRGGKKRFGAPVGRALPFLRGMIPSLYDLIPLWFAFVPGRFGMIP